MPFKENPSGLKNTIHDIKIESIKTTIFISYFDHKRLSFDHKSPTLLSHPSPNLNTF